MGTQETKIYRMVMINHDLNALKISSFWRENEHDRHTGGPFIENFAPPEKVAPPLKNFAFHEKKYKDC